MQFQFKNINPPQTLQNSAASLTLGNQATITKITKKHKKKMKCKKQTPFINVYNGIQAEDYKLTNLYSDYGVKTSTNATNEKNRGSRSKGMILDSSVIVK